jgi:hypothetical protein
MSKKLAASAKVFFIAVITAVGMFAIFAPSLTSLEIYCDLQEDQFYTCQSSDTLLGQTLKKVNATQVYEIELDLTCKGSGNTRGCSAHAEFISATGDRIIVSSRYTDPSQVQKVVNALDPLMASKSTPIDMTFPPSTFVSVIMISIGSCVVILLLLVAVLMLFGKEVKQLEEPPATDLGNKAN